MSSAAVTTTVPVPPTDYATRTEAEKRKWLAETLLPGTTYTLLSCYDRGTLINNILRVMYGVFEKLCEQTAVLAKDASSKLWRLCSQFIIAFNEGIGTFSNKVAEQCIELMTSGKFLTTSITLEPKSLGAGISTDIAAYLPGKGKKPTDWWAQFTDFLNIIVATYPKLNEVQPGMVSSYAALFTTLVKVGSTFYVEYTRVSEQTDNDAKKPEEIVHALRAAPPADMLVKAVAIEIKASDDSDSQVEIPADGGEPAAGQAASDGAEQESGSSEPDGGVAAAPASGGAAAAEEAAPEPINDGLPTYMDIAYNITLPPLYSYLAAQQSNANDTLFD